MLAPLTKKYGFTLVHKYIVHVVQIETTVPRTP